MADQNERLEGLRAAARESFSGLRADEALRLRILRAARQPRERRGVRPGAFRLVPAACGLLVLAIGGTAFLRGTLRVVQTAEMPAQVQEMDAEPAADGNSDASVSTLQAIRAGGSGEKSPGPRSKGIRASLQTGEQRTGGLFETSGREIPVVCMNGAAYQLLKEPAELAESLTGAAIGTVGLFTDTPSLEVGSPETVSDCTEAGTEIYSVKALPAGTAVAARVNGKMRLFQRVSYAGFALEGDSLSEVLGIGGQIREMTLSSAGTLSGNDAEEAFAVLLEKAVCTAEDAEPGEETLTFGLENGLKLQMTVSGNTLIGCGAWQCPEFLEAFRDRLK